MRLEEYLIGIGEIWCTESDLKETTLGARLANDGKLFERLRGGGGVTTGRLQDFLRFFRDGANWPTGQVPQGAADLLNNFGTIAVAVSASTGQNDDVSRQAVRV
ncbi:hypothetical protein FHR22_002594 [Sphingopyxis panaciterrae]|uniref:hypothetical protein n=1 Tax=Sphingopyxis panaciterrae TaxID=363841 RepID=UPI00141EB180|nr:hypothetical protein [Sphingopyxis panaciterrae]NIJ37891.1 hypothetical protein [Sphingopyxis panaciterrae]